MTTPSARQSDAGADESAVASHAAAVARSFLIGKLVLLPKLKLKAAGWFQPEDHASRVSARLAVTRFGRIGAWLLNYGGIYLSGVLLFEGHHFALRRLKRDFAIDEDAPEVEATMSALAGGFGGTLYALSATPLVSLLRLGPRVAKETWRHWARRALAGPLPYTLARDVGGFSLYFGTYSALRSAGSALERAVGGGDSSNGPSPAATAASAEASADGRAGFDLQLEMVGLAATVSSALVSGSAAGVATYLWRSPWDTLYKQRMGWRDRNAPLLSPSRFITSPRGLKAVGISAGTWAVYELISAGVRVATERGLLPSGPSPDEQQHARRNV